MSETEEAGTRRRRSRMEGGRSERGEARSVLPPQRSKAQPRMQYKPVEGVSAEGLEAIHDTSMQILEEMGMDFLDPDARALLAKAGARVEEGSNRVRFDREMVMEHIANAPSSFTFHAIDPANNLHIGDDSIAFCAVASPPNVSGLDGPRRVGNRHDYQNLVKLTQMLNCLHLMGGYPVEPTDIHPSIRHLDATFDAVTLCSKPLHAYSLGRQRNQDCLELIRIARQVDHETLEREPSVFTIINSSSPLRLDTPMLQGIMEYSSRNQIVCLTPFTLAGAMAPVTLAGALAQQNAEALAGLAFAQVVRPGAPVVYGGFTSNVDMQSGAPAFGTPEYMKSALVGGQLARRYNLPYRSSNVSAANSLDAQSAYESVFALWGAIMGGVNLVMHGAGWMEGGLHSSYEKMILDAELIQMIGAFLEPIVVDEASLAMDAIREVGPGGHYFGAAHTQSRYRDAFHKPMLSDWRNFEAWEEAGSPQVPGKANKIAKDLLAAYEPPPMESSVREELEAFVAMRKAEGGVPTDY